MFGAVKMPTGTPASDIGVTEFKCHLHSSCHLPAGAHPGKPASDGIVRFLSFTWETWVELCAPSLSHCGMCGFGGVSQQIDFFASFCL